MYSLRNLILPLELFHGWGSGLVLGAAAPVAVSDPVVERLDPSPVQSPPP